MAIPTQGIFRIYPRTATIVSGLFALASAPTVLTTDVAIGSYFELQNDNPAVAPLAQTNTETPGGSGVFVPTAATYELQFSPNTAEIVFDPLGVNETIDFLSANFPMGITMNQLQLLWNGEIVAGPSRDIFVANLKQKYFGSTILTTVPTPNVTFTGDILTDSNAIVSSLLSWSPLQVFKAFGFSFDISAVVSAGLNQPQVRSDLFYIQGVYSTVQFSITTPTPNALPGEIAEINDALGNLSRFGTLAADDFEFKIYWNTLEGELDVNSLIPGFTGGILIPRNLILEFTTTRFRFIMPNYLGLPYGGRRLRLTGKGNSIFFVGEFPLQDFNVELVDGSGLYTLVEDKTDDTYYQRSTTPVTTVDLKIPDPMVKTGFFNA